MVANGTLPLATYTKENTICTAVVLLLRNLEVSFGRVALCLSLSNLAF